MPSWLPGSSTNATSASSPGPWLNLEVPGQLKNTYGELTGENSQFAEWGFQLTRQQRLTGFIACVVLGFVLSLAGSILLLFNVVLFALLFSIGVVVSLVGTGFLIGFAKQLNQMFKPVRLVATLILLASFAMVWVSAFVIKSAISAIVFVVVLHLAYLWYSLSYIPYARNIVKNMVSKVF